MKKEGALAVLAIIVPKKVKDYFLIKLTGKKFPLFEMT